MLDILCRVLFIGAGAFAAWVIYNEIARHWDEMKAVWTGAHPCFFCGSYSECDCAEALELAMAERKGEVQ